MYKSRYRHGPARESHTDLETVEQFMNGHMRAPEPTFPTVEIPYGVRNRHIYIMGKTQHGKSTLLYSIISQDIDLGAGVCVLDPKPSGLKPNLVENILHRIPPHREDDVIYFDAANPIPIDVMSWESEDERQTLAADLMLTFMQFVTQKDGDRWPGILRYVIHTILDAKGCTFLDIHDFLADEDFRNKILSRVKRPNLLKYWNGPYKLFPKDAAVPIINRMATHMLVPPLNTMLGPAEKPLKIEDVILGRKILLVDLTGAGKESGNFIGMLLVSKIQQAVFRKLRTPFHLFADEFQNFQTSAFDTILSEAGGLGLRLTLANQYVDQMEGRIRQAVFGNTSTYVVFQLGNPEDAKYFKAELPADYKPEALAHQPPYQAFYAIAGQPPLFKKIPPPPPEATRGGLDRAQRIRERTLRDYRPQPSVSPILPHTAEDGSRAATDPPAAAAPTRNHDAPQKGAGRPAVPPVGTQQGHNRNPHRPLRREDNRPVLPRSADGS